MRGRAFQAARASSALRWCSADCVGASAPTCWPTGEGVQLSFEGMALPARALTATLGTAALDLLPPACTASVPLAAPVGFAVESAQAQAQPSRQKCIAHTFIAFLCGCVPCAQCRGAQCRGVPPKLAPHPQRLLNSLHRLPSLQCG